MNCARFNQIVDAWLDGELDAETSADIRGHAHECSACAALQSERLALARAVRGAMTCYKAPPDLLPAIRNAVARQIDTPIRRKHPTWLQAFAIAACAAMLSALITFWGTQRTADDPFREQVVATHVASLSELHRLLSVESGERHIVKPWFQGKIDFAPAVKDLSDAEFVLLGARIDSVGERQTAAIVYRVRSHVINLFVWRTRDPERDVTETRSRGFSIASWTEDGLFYAAVSDVNPRDLRRFAELMRAP
jgi:anti-sigma factor RsiW